MIKKMTVKEFVKKYTSLKNDKLKENVINDIKIKEYIPYERKADLCKALVNTSFYDKKEDENGNIIRTFKRDSIVEYMMFNLMLVNEYTSIEVEFKNNIEEFNMLNEPNVVITDESGKELKLGLIDILISKIPDRELKEFHMILDLTKKDLIQNEYETHAFIKSQVERFSEVLKVVAKSAEPALIEVSKKIEKMDEKDIKKLGDRIMKLIK